MCPDLLADFCALAQAAEEYIDPRPSEYRSACSKSAESFYKPDWIQLTMSIHGYSSR
jgi:hypothetical protein